MNKLLKADFFALIKSKLTYILLGICVFIPLLTVFLYLGISKMLEGDILGELGLGGMANFYSARTIMFGGFSLSNNTGLIIPIFVGIFTMMDIRNGTIRNKVIFGESRIKIYFSHLIVSITFSVIACIITFLVLAGGSLIFFEYGVEFTGDEALNFIRCLVIGLLTFAFIATVSTFLALVTKNLALTIILTLLISMGLGLITTLLIGVSSSSYKYLIYFVPTFANSVVVQSGELTREVFTYGLISYLGFSAINIILGIILFKKEDLK